MEVLGARLRDLERLGLAKRLDGNESPGARPFLWQGERWTLGAWAFIYWLYDVAIAGTHQVSAYDEWLQNEGYRSLLTQGQWEQLLDVVHTAIGRQICDIGSIAEDMFKELTRRRQNDAAR
jgi:hypothetical protein